MVYNEIQKIFEVSRNDHFGERGISQNIFMLLQEIFTAVAFELDNILCVSLLIQNLSVYLLNLLISSIATSCRYI